MRGLLSSSSSGLPICRTSLTTPEVSQEEGVVGTDEEVGAGGEGMPEEGEGAAGQAEEEDTREEDPTRSVLPSSFTLAV